MKRQICGSILMSALLLVNLPKVVRAETVTTTDGEVGKTDVTVSVTPDSDMMSPVDPDHPNKTVNDAPDNGVKPGKNLSLVYVTHTIKFDDLTTSPTSKSNSSDNSMVSEVAINLDPKSSILWHSQFVVEVGDERGTGDGWNLTVTGDPLTLDDNNPNKRVMEGAKIELPDGTIKRNDETKGGIIQPERTIQLGDRGANILKTSISDTGAGMTTFQMNPSEIKLSVPVSNVKTGDYKTTLNWTLSTGPSNTDGK
ncbi:WxL domain-containing protein [Lactiplantibacillus garii]|nr:WxL domain-containing protein [Lactiplantibacillus garii]